MNIKEIMHYYIGQKFRFTYTQGGWSPWEPVSLSSIDALFDFATEKNNIQLLLRPLDSMTEDEAKEYAAMGFLVPHTVKWASFEKATNEVDCTFYIGDEVHRATFSLSHNTFKQFHYLLTKGFDLFRLLESGNALPIDSNTLTQ